MKRQVSKILGFATPTDGYTQEEKLLEKALSDATVEAMFRKLPTSRMKFITLAHFEYGMKQELLADILGVTQEQVALEVRNIRKILLGKKFIPRPSTNRVKIDPQEVIQTLYWIHLT